MFSDFLNDKNTNPQQNFSLCSLLKSENNNVVRWSLFINFVMLSAFLHYYGLISLTAVLVFRHTTPFSIPAWVVQRVFCSLDCFCRDASLVQRTLFLQHDRATQATWTHILSIDMSFSELEMLIINVRCQHFTWKRNNCQIA